MQLCARGALQLRFQPFQSSVIMQSSHQRAAQQHLTANPLKHTLMEIAYENHLSDATAAREQIEICFVIPPPRAIPTTTNVLRGKRFLICRRTLQSNADAHARKSTMKTHYEFKHLDQSYAHIRADAVARDVLSCGARLPQFRLYDTILVGDARVPLNACLTYRRIVVCAAAYIRSLDAFIFSLRTLRVVHPHVFVYTLNSFPNRNSTSRQLRMARHLNPARPLYPHNSNGNALICATLHILFTC